MVPITVTFPTATKAQGSTSVYVVQTIANLTAPDISAEITAGTTVNVSCYLYGDFQPNVTTNKGDAPRRLCTTQQLQQFGNTTYEVGDLSYVYNPQAPNSDTANKAKGALVEGSNVYLVVRRGKNAQTAIAVPGDYVDVWYVRLGPQNRGTTGDGEFDEYAISQSVIALSPPTYDAQLVA